MLEQISELVKQYGQGVVVDNPDIPNEDNNAVLAEATSTITGGMQNMLAGGGLQDIISMFTGRGGNKQGNQTGGIGGLLKNPMVAMMIGHLISKLVGKFNMNRGQASQVANSLIPNVLNGLVTKTVDNDPSNDAFDLNDLIGSLTGGNTATATSGAGVNFQELIEQIGGGGNGGNNAGGSGGVDLQDIIKQVTQGAQQKQEQQAKGGGGITELIKGFFN
jgi:hypothetical protein